MSEENNQSNNDSSNEANPNVRVADEDVLERFKELKKGFDKELAKRDREIEELKKQLKAKDKVVDDTIDELNTEVKDNLKQAEEFREMQANMNKLLDENAEIAIDNYIKQGIIPVTNKDAAKELYLKDPEMFEKLFKNAPPIVDTSSKPQSKKQYDNVQQIADYFKN